MTLYAYGAATTIADDQPLKRPELVPSGTWRRTSLLGRYGVVAAAESLKQAGLLGDPEVGLIVGTGLADLEETLDFIDSAFDRGEALAKPVSFQRSVHSAAAGEISIAFGLRGYNLTLADGRSSSADILIAAEVALHQARCSRCLCVAADGLGPSAQARLAAVDNSMKATIGAVAVVVGLDELGARGPVEITSFGPDLGLHGANDLAEAVTRLGAP